MEINKPRRIVLKLSGESLKGDLEFGLDAGIIKTIATEIKKTSDLNVQISNLFIYRNYFFNIRAFFNR